MCFALVALALQDTLRDARHNMKSRVCKQYAAITSKVLSSRNLPGVTVSHTDLVNSATPKVDAFNKLTHPNSHAPGLAYGLYLRLFVFDSSSVT